MIYDFNTIVFMTCCGQAIGLSRGSARQVTAFSSLLFPPRSLLIYQKGMSNLVKFEEIQGARTPSARANLFTNILVFVQKSVLPKA